MLARKNDVGELRHEAESDDPQVEEEMPEVVLEVERVLQVEDVEVADHRDPVSEQSGLGPRRYKTFLAAAVTHVTKTLDC